MYQLKNGQEGFEVVDGPDAGKAYRRGRSYPNAPAGYENRFEKVTGKADKKTTKPDRTKECPPLADIPDRTKKCPPMAGTPVSKEENKS